MEKLRLKPDKNLAVLKKSSAWLAEVFLELLFPKSCVSCGRMGQFLCEKCLKEIATNSLQICFLCQRSITANGELCPSCKQYTTVPLDRLLVCGKYQDETLSKTIHLFKYKFIQELSVPLAELQTRILKHFAVPIPDLIIPVPLHKRRLRWRGYNQSALLANHISQNITPGMEIPVCENILFRTRNTAPQMKIKKISLRQENISGAFALFCGSENTIKGKRILLVDDVCTTGSTIFECAKTLSAGKPRSISAIVLARQS